MRRLLFISNLFPDLDHPIRGLDNATLLHSLRDEWDIRVLSPRAVMPPWRRDRLLPRKQDEVFSPRFIRCPYVPKFGSWCNDTLMRHFLAPSFGRIVGDFKPEVVLCSWLYPDGCAVAELAGRHKLPVVLVTQGTDTHGYLKYPVRRRKIVAAINRSAAVICRSGDLARRLHEAGAEDSPLKTVYNGVDVREFCPRSQHDVRRELNLPTEDPVLLFVGNYLPVKNPLMLIRAHAELNRRRGASGERPARLILIGDGPLRDEMGAAIKEAGQAGMVDLRGREAPPSVARWMSAANLLCLTSHNEGFPNVILEAMASGLKVVSTDVGGIAELVDRPERGLLTPAGDIGAYVRALEEALSAQAGEQAEMTSASEPDWSWEAAAREYHSILGSALAGTGTR
ncbi:glycosyltransferase [Luteolibacter sp. SL250]|uniref:glycosyltransferase n=1 Tax=Luteolibacter sp. SL250 TaxID=2995170 RepID=UPI0022718B37|nr:glycosyltransferase [Luteolibacter sp. SL250]WAC19623.1 glycosyltransferase [Luteolibacter sp. SL250]